MTEFLSEKQKEDLQFFDDKLNELLENPLYQRKFVLIHNKSIEGIFDTFENAAIEAVSRFQPYEFVIQQIIADTEITGFIYSDYAEAQQDNNGLI